MNNVVARSPRWVVLLITLVVLGRPAHAIPLVFDCIASGQPKNCAIGEAQMLIEVADSGDGEVAFTFTNDGPGECAIARIYVEDERRTLAGPPAIHQDAPDVIFDVGVSPKNLPGAAGASPAFNANPALSVAAEKPPRTMGVNPGEQVGLVYPLAPGRTFEDVIADLSVGNLRFGIHVVGFASKGSESFVSQVLLTETLE